MIILQWDKCEICLLVLKMTPEELTVAQRQLIDQIAIENNFVDYQVKTVSGSIKGDNYLGVITSVTIEDGNKKMELILKSAQQGEFRSQMPIHNAYVREIFLYETVFTKFKEFQEQYCVTDPFRSPPKLYGASNAEPCEFLVMENLRENGHRMWNRKLPMDHQHLSTVLKEYAKFHAVSLAMREKKPEVFRELTKDMAKHIFEEFFNNPEQMGTFVKAVMANVCKVFEDDPVTTEILKGFEKRLPDTFEAASQKPEKVVIEHGDCWCNNLMFGYENEENPSAPSDVRIIDWQLSKVGSPASDLVYFFLVHAPKDILYDYERYLKIYHDTLSKNLQEFSCDPETVFPFSLLLEHWKKRVKMGIYLAFNILKLMLCESEDAPDFSEISEDGKNIMDMMAFTVNETYKTRIKDLVEFSIANDFL